ncbi:MAG: leucine-rich repeat domain-containing protein [Clostridia bacterium]|nr:leucine-rich repeat domain-containing protein [Clostridia bacterium]
MKKFFLLFLALLTVIILASCEKTYDMNETLEWSIENETLRISADGSIGTFCHENLKEGYCDYIDAPWKNEVFDTVILEDNITYISEHAFYECEQLERVIILGENVTVGHSAFAYCKNLTEVENSDRIICIEEGAFKDCEALGGITFGNALTKIEEVAFDGCISLKEIYIPASVSELSMTQNIHMGGNSFMDCTALESIVVDEGNTTYASRDGVLYTANMKTLLFYPLGKQDTDFTPPPEVEKIASYAFMRQKLLKTVNLESQNITDIGYEAFLFCDTTLICKENSIAYTYAQKNNIPFELR